MFIVDLVLNGMALEFNEKQIKKLTNWFGIVETFSKIEKVWSNQIINIKLKKN